MKVTMVSTWDTACGIADYTGSLRAELVKCGVEVAVVPIDRIETAYMAAEELKAHFEAIGDGAGSADVIHVQHEFGFFAGSYGTKVAITTFRAFLRRLLRHGKPVFVTFHSEPTFVTERAGSLAELAKGGAWRALWSPAIARLFKSSKHLHAVVHTRGSRVAFIDSGFDSASLSVLEQGVPLRPERRPLPPPERDALKQELGLPADSVVVALFGFMSRYKGYRTALGALRALPEQYHLLFVGGPHPYAGDLALEDTLAYIGKHPELEDRVTVTGFVERERLDDYHRVTDVCIAPYEPRPKVSSSAALTWALSSGKPIVASAVPAFVELKHEADCLLLVPPEAPRALAQRIEEVAEDTALQRRLVANAEGYCAAHGWDRTAEQHVALYARALGRDVPAASDGAGPDRPAARSSTASSRPTRA